MVSFSSAALLALAYVSCLVNATPLVVRGPLDVASPPVTYPTQGVVWKVGETRTVTWDTSNLPKQITNPNGKVVLGWLGSGGGFNLQLNSPLAEGFPITAGKVDITVPSQYPDGDSYIIALLGSSDNTSPAFTITRDSSTPTSAAPSPSTTPSPAAQPSTSVPGDTPSTTPGSSSSIVGNAVPGSPSSSPSIHSSGSSGSSSHSSSGPSSSPSPSSSQGSSNGNASDNSSAWGNKPANAMVVSLLAASLVALFL